MKISVALCTYNGSIFIKDQLSSILTQTCPVDEIIICDDLSTDITLDIIFDYSNKFPGIIKIYKNKSKLSIIKNFEKAISLCTGDIIFLSDQDDIWDENKVEIITDFFIDNDKCNVLFTNAELIGYDNKLLTSKTLFDIVNLTNETKKYFLEGLDFELLNIDNRITGATMAFRKSYIINTLPFQKFEKILHDEYIAISAINDNCISMIDKCLIKYRIHNNQVMGLADWLETPPDSNVFKFKTIKNDYTLLVNFTGKLKQKINLWYKREKIIKSSIGFLILIFTLKDYILVYGKYANKFILADFEEYVKLNSRRFKRIFNAKSISNSTKL